MKRNAIYVVLGTARSPQVLGRIVKYVGGSLMMLNVTGRHVAEA